MFFPFRDDNPTVRTPWVTYAVVALNVAALLWLSHLPDRQQMTAVYRWGFVPARIRQLSDKQPIKVVVSELVQHPLFGVGVERQRTFWLAPDPSRTLLSLLTCMFLHGGWLHLLGNMWFLWLFGNNVEDRLGHLPYLGLYLLGGLTASVSHWVGLPTSTAPVIGASGAVATVLGAYAITWPWARVRTLVFLLFFITVLDVPALLVLGVWFLTQVVNAVQGGGAGVTESVAWWAHVGGFVAGLILMPIFNAAVGGLPPGHGPGHQSQDDFFV
jgi:membrane associated rhomboid family serine protease